MKKLLTLLLFLSMTGVTAFAQFANKSLSNLSSPTAINKNLLPSSAGLRDLGSSAESWRDLYITGSLYIGGLRFLSTPGGASNGNSALGLQALNSYSNSGGYGIDNTANGYQALFNNTDGDANTAIGMDALYSDVGDYTYDDGGLNTAIGVNALYSNTVGSLNTADGEGALYSNITGSGNTAMGPALEQNTTGSCNTASGFAALDRNTTGSYNTAVGYSSLSATTQSQYNTAIGFDAGLSYDNGYNNVFLGAYVDVNGADYYNDVAIGQGTICTAVSQVTMGNSATTTYRAYANWSNISDGRFKKNIKENVPGLVFINKLQPITYTLDATGIDQFLHKDIPQDKSMSDAEKAVMDNAFKEKEQIIYTGFVAQDVEKAAQSLNYDFSGVDAPKNDKDLYGLRYSDFVIPLVKAVQELSVKNDSKDSTINSLQLAVGNLQDANQKMQTEIDELKAAIVGQQSGIGNQVSGESAITNPQSAILYQNTPNPFSQNTTIQFCIPLSATDAMIVVSDLSGKAMQQFSHLACGNGTITIASGALASGTYQYSLLVNGKVIDTKQMMITR